MIKGFTVYVIFAVLFVFGYSEVFSQNSRVLQSGGTVQNLYSLSFINSSDLSEGNPVLLNKYNLPREGAGAPVSEFEKSGHYDISLNLENFTNGTYKHKINAGNF